MHAELLCTLYNAHFETKGNPWSPDDFLGLSDRNARNIKTGGQIKAKIAALRGGDRSLFGPIQESEIPEWARKRPS